MNVVTDFPADPSNLDPHWLRVFFSGTIAQQQIKLMQQRLVDLNFERRFPRAA